MKITGVFPINGRGHAIMTDEPFSAEVWQRVRNKKELKVIHGNRIEVFAIICADVIVRGSAELISFVVADIKDMETQDFILGREIEIR